MQPVSRKRVLAPAFIIQAASTVYTFIRVQSAGLHLLVKLNACKAFILPGETFIRERKNKERTSRMDILVPGNSLVVLCGTAGAGKSSFAHRFFKATEIVSSDRCRALVGDDEADMTVSREAFILFKTIIDLRLSLGRLVVADSTALTRKAREDLRALARKNNSPVVVLVFDISVATCFRRDCERERKVGKETIERQRKLLDQTLRTISTEGYDRVYILRESEMDNVSILKTDA